MIAIQILLITIGFIFLSISSAVACQRLKTINNPADWRLLFYRFILTVFFMVAYVTTVILLWLNHQGYILPIFAFVFCLGGVFVWISYIEAKAMSLSAVKKSEAKFNHITKYSPFSMIAINKECKIISINEKAKELLGYPENSIIGKDATEIFVREIFDNNLLFTKKYSQDASNRNLAICNKKTQAIGNKAKKLDISLSAYSWDENGEVFCAFIFEDLSETQRLTQMVEDLQRNESIGRLAGGIAHDFNNNLAVITVSAEFALEDAASTCPKIQSYLQDIIAASSHAAELTKQLLAYGRKQVLNPTDFELNNALTESIKMIARTIGENIEIKTNFDPECGYVSVDKSQIKQAIVNLAINARDAMPKGGTLFFESGYKKISNSIVNGQVVQKGTYSYIKVRDTGTGIPKSIVKKIFEPFFTTKPFGRGSGMGLASVLGIVKQSGGFINVDTKESFGTIFTIYFPKTTGSNTSPEKSTILSKTPHGNETVLVVEDEDPIRTVIVSGLRKQGYTVMEAQGGQQALELMTTYQKPIHLLLSDIVMPKMSGTELVQEMTQRNIKIPVMYMSGYSAGYISEKGIDTNINFIAKPFSMKDLIFNIQKATQEAQLN